MNPIFAISDFGELVAQNGFVAAIHTMLAGLTETTLASASVLTPPGGESASAQAVVSQVGAVQQFGAMANLALEQLMEHTASTDIFSATTEAVEVTEAANLAAVLV